MEVTLVHGVTAISATDSLSRVLSLSFSPDGLRLACCLSDSRHILLVDTTGAIRDRIGTKPANNETLIPPSTTGYQVRCAVFSPDSYRLAVTQSDGLVVVYRIGGSWKEKKSISNKFRQSVAVVGVVWPARGEDSEQLVFGGVDGKVKLGNLRTNKPASLYAAESPLLCMCGSPNGNCVLTAHLDGSVYKFSFDDGSGRPSKCRLWVHPCPPLAMAWSARDEVAAGGSDGRIRFFSPNSGSERLSVALAGGDCSSLCFSPSGLALTAGTFHRVTVFETGLSSASTWRKGQVLEIPGLYTASALCWRADGTRLAVGSLCGAVELFDAHTTRHLLKGRFVVTFSAPSDAVVTDRDTGARVRVKSGSGTALHSVDVARADLVVGRTDRSVIMGLLSSPAASASGAFAPLATEVPWSRPALEGGKRERVLMVPGEPGLLLIAAPGGEVSVVDLSNNSNGQQQQPVVGSFWTGSLVAERVSAVRLAGGRVRVAYLTDKATAQVVDLPEAVQVAASLRLPGPASRLLLSPSGALLAVSVGAGSLIVHPLGMGVKAGPGPGLGPTAAAAALAGRPTTAAAAAAMAGSLDQGPAVVLLARGCRGALWVPGTDVLVGLYDGTLAMWPLPTASAPMVVARDLSERSKLVSVDAGAATARVVVAGGAEDDAGAVEVALDGPLLRLHASVTRAPLLEAVAALDACPLEREDAAAPLWGLLLRRALMSALPPSTSGAAVAAAATAEGAPRLRAETLRVAIRCAGALGDTAKSRFLESLARECSPPSEGERSPVHLHIIFLAGLAMLRSDFAEAENLLLSGGLADRAIAMYKSLGSWRQAVTLALTTGHPKAQSIAREHEAWLAKTGQFAHAARLHEDAGETARAVELYLLGGAPARAAELIVASDRKAVSETTARAVVDRLTSCGLWLPAAKVLEWLGGQPEQAVSLYAKAERFGEAVRLCRRHKDTALADKIPALEREWGAALLRDGYPEVAAGHFAEAGEHAEAAAACAAAGTWGKCLSHLTKVLPELAGDPMLPAAVASQAAPQADQLAPLFLIPSLRVTTTTPPPPPQKGGLYSTALSAASHLLSTAPNTSVLLAASAGEPLLALALRVCATRLALGGGGSDLARRAVQAGLPASAPEYQALTEVLAAAGRPEDAALAQAMVSAAAPAASSKKTARRSSKDGANAVPAASPRGSPSPKPKKREPERLMAARDWAGALAALESLGSSPVEAALAVCRRVLPGPDAPAVAAAIGGSLDPALAALIEEGSLEAAEALLVTAFADAQGRNQASALALSTALVAAGQEGHAVSLLVSLGLASAAVDVLIGKGRWESALALARDRCPERVPAIERASAPPLPAVTASISSPPSARAASSGRARSGGKVRKEKVLAVLSGVRDGDDAAAKAAADVLQHKVTLERLEELHESLVVPRSGVSALALEVLSQVYARRLCSERHRATAALAVLARSPSLRMPETAEVLVVCARDLLAGVELVPRGAAWIGVVHQLRAQLGRVERDPGTELFQTTEWVVHLQWVATLSAWKALQGDAAGSRALKTVSAKAAIALLRHCDALAVDRAFFEAGMASRECGLARAAFSFFTRYLDLAEAMADTEGTFDLDNQIFEDTDLPADFSLPFHTSITADEQEEVRSWLLQQSLDDSGPALPTAPCPHCAKPKYSASLACFACETRFQPCVVTGFPLLKERATCQHCDRQANKTDWATYLSAMQGLCPWCNEQV